jgi:hypothetical protein
MTEAIKLHADVGAWSLAALADEAAFERHHVAVVAAIADRLGLRVDIDTDARRRAFADWIASLQETGNAEAGADAFVAICARLIVALAGRPIVAYAWPGEAPPGRMAAVVLRFPNEVTALASGAAVYLLRVRALTGRDPSIALPALVVENAAANLRHNAEAAFRFRELLQLTMPWD